MLTSASHNSTLYLIQFLMPAALCLWILLLCSNTQSAPAKSHNTNSADKIYFFNVDQNNLIEALKELARQSDSQLLLDPIISNLHQQKSTAVVGYYRLSSALKHLLGDNSLDYDITADRVILIRPRPSTVTVAKPEAQPDIPAPYPPLENIVVIGTPGGAGVHKLDAGFAIVTADEAMLRKSSAQSTADLFRLVPGIFSDTSGGVSGANVYVRGLPSGGDAPYVTVSLQGAPIFPASTLDFLENSTLFRLDETVESMEALLGGTNSVYSGGQPGLTTNFRLKDGTETTEGTIRYSTSNYNLDRWGFRTSGKVTDEFFYMIGGYRSRSSGIRETDFDSEQGKQFTVNLTGRLSNMNLNVYTRYTNDHGMWYTPSPRDLPGQPDNVNYLKASTRLQTLRYGPDNNNDGHPDYEKPVDLGKGRGWHGSVSGGSIKYNFGNDWTLINYFNHTYGNADTYGLVPDGAATSVANLNITGGSPPLLTTISGRPVDADDYVQRVGYWVVQQHINSFNNDFSLSKWLTDQYKITLGYYAADFSSEYFWSLGNSDRYLLPNGDITNLDCTLGVDADHDGQTDLFDHDNNPLTPLIPRTIGCGWKYDLMAHGTSHIRAFYSAHEIHTEKIIIDVGMRYETHHTRYSMDEGIDHHWDHDYNYKNSTWAATTGASWALTDDSRLYSRLSYSHILPRFDTFRVFDPAPTENECETSASPCITEKDLIKTIKQLDLGYKIMTDESEAFIALFNNTVRSGDPTLAIPEAAFFNSESIGMEAEIKHHFNSGISLSTSVSFQKFKIISTYEKLHGNHVQRQPDWQFRLMPSYEYNVRNIEFQSYLTVSIIGKRFNESQNLHELDRHTLWNVGTAAHYKNAFIECSIDNLTNDDSVIEQAEYMHHDNVRTVLPRSIKLTVGYDF